MQWILCLFRFYLIRTIKNQIKKVIHYFGRSIEFVHHVHYFMMNRIEFFSSMICWGKKPFGGGSVIRSFDGMCIWFRTVHKGTMLFKLKSILIWFFFFVNRSIVNLLMSIVHCPSIPKKTLVNSNSKLKTFSLHDSIVHGCVFDSILNYQIPLFGTFNHFIYQKSFFTSCDFNFAL